MKTIAYGIRLLFISTFLILMGCSNTDKNNNNTDNNKGDLGFTVEKLKGDRPNLNISILLDLSDRISPNAHPNATMQYYQRDIGYISSISTAFLNHIVNKEVRKINDRMQIFFDPLPSNSDINNMAEQLKVKLNKNNTSNEKLIQIRENYDSLTKRIYNLAINAKLYPGSDIWGFFNDKVKDYCIREDHRNVLVIITDGYMYYVNNTQRNENRSSYLTSNYIMNNNLNNISWEKRIESNNFGFIPATSGLENLDILVLGLNPNNSSPYEKDVMLKFWSNWFDEMGVSNYELKTADLPSNLDENIKDFIWEE